MNKWFKLAILLMVMGVSANAAGDFTQLDNAGIDASTATASTISAFRWVFAIIPFGVGLAAAAWMWADASKKAEMSQEETKASKIFKPIAGFVAGVFVTFLIYGVFGSAFLNPSNQNAGGGAGANQQNTFAYTWDLLVTSFWINAFKQSRTTYTKDSQ